MFNLLNRRPQGNMSVALGDDTTGHDAEKVQLLDALKKISASRALIAADLPDGMFRESLTELEASRAKRERLDRSNLAHVAKHASEAAINVGWTTYDIGDIARSTQSIASAIEEMSASISEVSQTSQSAGHSADSARTSMSGCMSDVDQAREAMKAIDARTHQIDERLRVLQGAIAQIGTMAGTIATISSQTNLLALNATIEAARAGEAGRGFAVVAAEVKSLSGQTAKSTEQIRTWLTTLQSEMEQIARAVDESRGAVAHGSNIVLVLGDRVEEATRQISQTSDMSQALAATLQQQRAATAEVSGSVQGIADKASKTHTEIENITKRLVKAETFAQDALAGDDSGSVASELTRLPADIGHWKRRAAQILVGVAPPERTVASLRGGIHRRAVETLDGQSPAGQAAIHRFLTADASAHKEIDSMISAVAAGNWDVGTPAYKAACVAMKDMETAAQDILNEIWGRS